MANYLITHYKGKYRILCDVCADTNDFPRKINGTYEDIDCYISCEKGIKIFSFGHGILECYIPSIKYGRNFIRTFYRDNININNTSTALTEYSIKRENNEIYMKKETIYIIDEELFKRELTDNKFIFDIVETDSEMMFKFKAAHMELLASYLKPRISGANISPFSNKNRPKTKYKIPDEDLLQYKNIVSKLTQDKMVFISVYTNEFLKTLATKKKPWDDIKSDMILKGLKNKEYLHCIGKWNSYLKYLEERICQN